MLVAAGFPDEGVTGPAHGGVQVGEQPVEPAFGQASRLVRHVGLQQGPDPRPVRCHEGVPRRADQPCQEAEDLGGVAQQ